MISRKNPVAKFLVPDWGDKGGSIPARQTTDRLVGRYDNPMPESIIPPQSGSKNLASVRLRTMTAGLKIACVSIAE